MDGDSWLYSILMYYKQWQKGFLPEAGGVNDQPAKFFELMAVVERTINVLADKKADREKRNPKNGNSR